MLNFSISMYSFKNFADSKITIEKCSRYINTSKHHTHWTQEFFTGKPLKDKTPKSISNSSLKWDDLSFFNLRILRWMFFNNSQSLIWNFLLKIFLVDFDQWFKPLRVWYIFCWKNYWRNIHLRILRLKKTQVISFKRWITDAFGVFVL